MQRFPQLLKVFIVLLFGVASAPAETAEFEQIHARVEATQPEGVRMELKLPKTRYHQGEVIPATLVFRNSSKQPYFTWIGTYDRSGRIQDIGFRAISEQGKAVVDPLEDYFKHGAFMGGGLGNFSELGEWEIKLPVNEWLRFDQPGIYRLYGWSQRITPGSKEDRYREGVAQPGPVELVSALVTIQIDPLPPAREQEVLEQIRKDLESKGEGVAGEAMQRLRHLQTPAARDLARSLLGGPYDPGVQFALLGAPDPKAEAAAILAAVRAGLLAIDQSTLNLYRRLQGSGAFLQNQPDNVEELFDAARETLRGDLKSAVASRNLVTLFQLNPKEPTTRALAVAHQLELTDSATDALLQFLGQATPEAGDAWRAEFLPLVRRAAGPPRNLTQALQILAKLEPAEARQRIVDDIQHPPFKLSGHGGNHVYDLAPLCALPKELLLPELDETFRDRLRSTRGNRIPDKGIAATMMLVARYGTPTLLPDVLRAYEPGAGRWACAIQADALRYLMRCDPKVGVPHLQKALAARKETGCFHTVISDVLRQSWSPEALPVVLAALDDPDEQVLDAAAEMLSLHAPSPEIAERIVATAERLGALPLPPVPSDQSTAIYRQNRLVQFVAEGDAWKLTREQLARLIALPHIRKEARANLETRLNGAEK